MGPGDWKPTPTGRIIVDFLNGKMPAYVDTGLNLVPVEDVAAGHLLAAESGRIGERYILGGRNMTLKEILDALAVITGRPAPRVRIPHAVALAAGYADEWFSRLTGREPQIPVEGVKMSRHRMFVASDKAERELGYKPGRWKPALERAVRWYEAFGIRRRRAAASRWRTRRRHRDSDVRILVTFALENEFAPWRALRKFRRSKWDAAKVYVAEIGGGGSERDSHGSGPAAGGAGNVQGYAGASRIPWSSAFRRAWRERCGRNIRSGRFSRRERWWRSELRKDAMAGVLEGSAPLVSFAEDCGATVGGSLLQRRARGFARGGKAALGRERGRGGDGKFCDSVARRGRMEFPALRSVSISDTRG